MSSARHAAALLSLPSLRGQPQVMISQGFKTEPTIRPERSLMFNAASTGEQSPYRAFFGGGCGGGTACGCRNECSAGRSSS